MPSPSTTPHEVRRWQGPGRRGARSTTRHDDRSPLLPRRSSGCTMRKTPSGGRGRGRSQSLGRRNGSSGTPWSTLSTSSAARQWCRFSMLLCRSRWNSWWMCSGSSMRLLLFPSRLSKCPRSSSRTSRRESRFASRSWRNSWWKCRRSFLIPLCSGTWSKTLTFQFLVVEGDTQIFKVFSEDKVQQVPSRSLIFLVEVFKVLALDRVRQRLRLFSLQLVRMMTRMSLVKGFFQLFPVLKKAQSWLRTRGRHCSPSRAHPRRLLSWRTPSSGCSSETATLASLTTGTDVPSVLSGSRRLASRSCGLAKGMRIELSGTGTGTCVSPRLSSLLFLLGEELYRQPRAVYKYWAGGLPSCDHAATSSSSSSSSFFDKVLDIPVMLQRQVFAVQLCRCAVRIVLRLWTSLWSYSSSFCIPTRTCWCLRFRSSTECYSFQLYCRIVHVQCNCAKTRRCHSAVLGQVVHAPVVVLRQLLGVGQCRKLWRFRSCSWCSSWRLLTRPLFLRRKALVLVQTVQKTVKFPVAFLELVHCPSLCNDRCRIVETVQKTVESRSWCCLDKVVDVPVLATSWSSRGSAVAVHQLVCQLIMAMMSSGGIFLGPCTQVHGQG